jgi:formylglycine-generating enzyme required for sulfatase activity
VLLIVALILVAFLLTQSSYAVTIKGKVVDIQGKVIELDIGSEKGIKAGDTGRVYYTVTVGKEIKPIYVANFKITHPTPKSSMAKIEGDTTGEIKKGYLVEVTVQAAKKVPPPQKVVKKGLKPGQVWKDPYLGMEFVWVPGGCYEMGQSDTEMRALFKEIGEKRYKIHYDDELPQHTVCVDGFWMGRYEVTQGQWQRLMGDNPSRFKDCGDDCPVEQVLWNEAVEFARRLSQKTGYTFRLPTEAEWEYACRSGGRRKKYSGSDNVDAVAWYEVNSDHRTHSVGQKRSNGLGIYDMSGNVWEWCKDGYTATYYSRSPRDNPPGPASGFFCVIRGGGYSDTRRYMRCANRAPGYRDHSAVSSLGFRLVRVGQQ